MLELVIPDVEYWDEQKEEFITKAGRIIQLEHSLVSISKWESKWRKAFLGKKEKTDEETIDYIKCMTLTPNVDSEVYSNLSSDNLAKVREYINAPMTATCLPEDKPSRASKETVTSELIYYWMIAQNIPVEFETWHINRLITLIKVCSLKNKPTKKRGSAKDTARRYAEMNAARRKQLNSKG